MHLTSNVPALWRLADEARRSFLSRRVGDEQPPINGMQHRRFSAVRAGGGSLLALWLGSGVAACSNDQVARSSATAGASTTGGTVGSGGSTSGGASGGATGGSAAAGSSAVSGAATG